jgi:hypothetical protein
MMYSYMSQFFGGALDPNWPHAILIAGTIVGGALVGLGVVLEAPKIISIPVAAVFVGVVFEAACTLLLFGFDEGISSAQLSKIISLETKLAPRFLSKPQADALIATAKRFPGQQYALSVAPGAEPLALLCQLHGILQEYAGWKLHAPVVAALATTTDCIDHPVAALNFGSGIHLVFKFESNGQTKSAVDSLTATLAAAGLEAHSGLDNTNIPETNLINLIVGAKL